MHGRQEVDLTEVMIKNALKSRQEGEGDVRNVDSNVRVYNVCVYLKARRMDFDDQIKQMDILISI